MIPVAVFTYNRPDHAKSVLESLSSCERLDECGVYIFCDGPKTGGRELDVATSRDVVHALAPKLNARIIKRPTNLGLARSIVTGVTELCEEYGRVIVLEDDHIVSPDFLDYMIQALNRYQNTENVYQVSGYMFDVDHPDTPDAFFLPLTTTWGWATWDRAWGIFDWHASGSRERLADLNQRRIFDLDDSYPYYEMLQRKLLNRNDSWGILWWWAVFNVGGLVLHPRKSLVWQGGLDGSGTHSGHADLSQDARERFLQPRLSHSLKFPESVVSDEDAFARIKVFLRGQQVSRAHSIISKVRAPFTKILERFHGIKKLP